MITVLLMAALAMFIAALILLRRLPDQDADLAELRAIRERKQARKEGSR